MKSKFFGLNDDVVTVYDQTKTTITNHITQKTINSELVLGPPLNAYIDTQTDTTPFGAVAIIGQSTTSPYQTANITRMFILGPEVGGLVPLLLYTFNITTGAHVYIGKIIFRTADVAATTTTFRMLKVDDVGTTNWKIFVGTTGSVLINGGQYMLNKIDLADFTASGTTINFATGDDQKAVYFLQDPAGVGAGNILTAIAGGLLDRAGQKAYIQNGIAATYQFWVFDYSIAPTYVTNSVTGVAATDVISDAGHTFVNGDPVVFTALTGGTGLVVGTPYFVVGSVAGVSYQLSATTGGAAINFTTDITAATIGRAFGTSTNIFLHKTGNLPALVGTLLLNNSVDSATPGHSTNAGFLCAAFATSTQIYFGQLSELTSGAVTWPSLISANINGATNEVTAITAAVASWGQSSDRFYFNTNTALIYGKQLVNNIIDFKLGFLNTEYYEGTSLDTYEFGATTVIGMDNAHGWIFFTSTTTGQRGVFAHCIHSNSFFDVSYIVSKVLTFDALAFKLLGTIEEYFDVTSPMVFYYRTSGFGSISGGWTQIQVASDLSAIAPGTQFQMKIAFNPPDDGGTNGSQIADLAMTYEALNENSEQWQVSKDLSSTGATHKVVWYLSEAYASTVPTLYARAFQQGTTTSVGSGNTSANPTQFRYSTNGGTSWTALGTIPNVVGTLVEWTPSVTPTVDYLPSLREF